MSDIIKIAVLAVGGQGGGVLSGWIAKLAESCGYRAQVTSVAGVAQRTGATIYYVEIAPDGPKDPVFALSATPGDVDILIAAEIMEAGRAAQRGFVTPDRTTLIASTHRILAISEKQIPGDGRRDETAVLEELKAYAQAIVAFDMDYVARDAGSFISAGLFGGLARSGALPFSTDDFRAVLSGTNKGAEASMRAFDAALNYEESHQPARQSFETVVGPKDAQNAWDALLDDASAMPTTSSDMLHAGMRKTVDYQDVDYGWEYLDRLKPFLGHSPALDEAAAKYIANAMCYDDLPRVADLKTRAARTERLRAEQEIPQEGVVRVTEYFHPRAEEVCATLPVKVSAFIEARPWAMRSLSAVFSKGRRVRTDSIFGFTLLWCVAGLRLWRRRLARHKTEMAHVDRLTEYAMDFLPDQPELAAEILACQRLIKGYSDTHARGHSRFDRVLQGVDLVHNRDDAADWVRRLREAALGDTTGAALDGALQTVRSFTSKTPKGLEEPA